ncbi:histidine kinase [Sinomicrobium kalidii]|uniref:sensor histidine kinase n=1 Tax=Sinomicrobium kalidii TaxID=2900738 RepID=UPI001E3D1B30|nr:sensor histidine kinase [Sinomicrobium kalidii]UGU17405.1 histidine kinase [Sinomicrobium kalidii]
MLSFEKEYKGWPPERIARHVLYWSCWVTFYCVINASYQGTGYMQWFLLELIFMTVKLPYAYFVAYYLFPKFLPQKKYVTLFSLMLLFAFLGVGFLVILLSNFPQISEGQPTEFWSVKTFFRAIDLIYVASLVVVIKMIQRYLRQERMNAQLKEDKVNAELQILKNQLQPHFLFNTLNNIYSIVLSGDKNGAGAILKLSDILSYMLYECNVDLVGLEKEVGLIENYIQLEKIRYGERLDLSFEVDGGIKGKTIAPLILIPFVENAFKHGVFENEKYSWIRIHLQTDENELTFIVENSLPENNNGNSAVKSGIGLNNVKKRLELLYPEKHHLIMTKTETFLINLKISL